jgi:plasmid stability protein
MLAFCYQLAIIFPPEESSMATITVRKLNEKTRETLGERAKKKKRSLEAEVRAILDREAQQFDIDAWIADVRALRNSHRWKLPEGVDSLSLLREERDSW